MLSNDRFLSGMLSLANNVVENVASQELFGHLTPRSQQKLRPLLSTATDLGRIMQPFEFLVSKSYFLYNVCSRKYCTIYIMAKYD